nr:ABC transporter substrate-binding protein [Thiorhodovibrio frisius]
MRPLLLCAALVTPPLAQGAAPVSADGADSLPAVRIALQWSPQSQFAGFYLARQQGFYTAAGARVSLLHGNALRSSLAWLRQGKAELATAFLADAMVAAANSDTTAAEDPRPVLIGQLVRRSNLMLLAWKDHGISHLEDLDGRRVSLMPGPFSAAIRALLAEHQIQPELIPQYGTVNLFLHRGVSACAAMEYNEFHRVWQAGVDTDQLTVFLPRELGFDFPEDGLYARSDWLKDHGELAQRLWNATIKGWEYARDHPEEALDLVLTEAKHAGIPANRPHERWMLKHLLAAIFGEHSDAASANGQLSARAYAATAKALIAADFIKAPLPFAVFCPRCDAKDKTPSMAREPRPRPATVPASVPGPTPNSAPSPGARPARDSIPRSPPSANADASPDESANSR